MAYDQSDWDKDYAINGTEEEFAKELGVPAVPGALTETNSERSTKPAELSRSRRIGYTALILALLSMFIWPVILGPAAIILGYLAFRGGKRGIGSWSIALGLLSLATYFLLMRLYP